MIIQTTAACWLVLVLAAGAAQGAEKPESSTRAQTAQSGASIRPQIFRGPGGRTIELQTPLMQAAINGRHLSELRKDGTIIIKGTDIHQSGSHAARFNPKEFGISKTTASTQSGDKRNKDRTGGVQDGMSNTMMLVELPDGRYVGDDGTVFTLKDNRIADVRATGRR